MGEKYIHKQKGGKAIYFVAVLCVTIILVLWCLYIGTNPSERFAAVGTFAFVTLAVIGSLLFCAMFLSSLTVKIDNDFVLVRFGIGVFENKFAIKDIVSCRTVKNSFIDGWGIHWCISSSCRLYNVAGFDAVEITMKSGKKNRIGTDESQKLADAITSVIQKS